MPSPALAPSSRSTPFGTSTRAMLLRATGRLILTFLVCSVTLAASAAAATTYRARSIDGTQAPPPYGLRLDGFFDGQATSEVTFHFDEVYFDVNDDGTAHLRGEIAVAEINTSTTAAGEDAGCGAECPYRYLLDVHFLRITDPGELALIEHYRSDWTYYNIVPEGVEMQRLNAPSDSTHLWTYPVTGQMPFQVGVGANEKNQNLGAAGWLSFLHYKHGNVYGGGPGVYLDASDFLMDLEPLDQGPCDSVKTVDNFTLRFLGVTYDLGGGTSRWDYELTWDGTPPELSQLTLELCREITDDDLVAATPANGHVGPDGSTGLYGIKWDPPPHMPAGQPVLFSYTLNRLLEVEESGFFPKAAINNNFAQICGPSLDCNEPTTPCLENSPPVATCPPDMSITVCGTAPICLPGFSCFDEDGNVSSSTVIGGELSGESVCFSPAEGVHTIILSCVDSCGAEDRDTVRITMTTNAPPTVQAPPVPSPLVCTPENGIVCIPGWTFSDPDGDRLTFGTMGSGTFDPATGTFCKPVDAPGQYTMMLAVSDSCGATATTSLTFEVLPNEKPTVQIVADTMYVCQVDTVCFDVVITDDHPESLEYHSNFGWVAEGRFCFTADTSGEYTLAITVTDACGESATDTATVTVTINRPPAWVLVPPGSSSLAASDHPPLIFATRPDESIFICAGDTLVCLSSRLFVGDPDPGDSIVVTVPDEVTWNSDNGALCLVYPTEGEFVLVFTATDTCGASSAETLVVLVRAGVPPQLEFSSPDTTLYVCDPDTSLCFTVTAAGSEPITIEEVLNPGSFDAETGVFCFNPDSVCFDHPGTVDTTICIVFRATNECGSVTDSLCVTVISMPPPTVTMPADTTVASCALHEICVGPIVIANPSGSPLIIQGQGADYRDGYLCFTPTEPGLYTLGLQVSDTCGHVVTDSVWVDVRLNDPPVISGPSFDTVGVCGNPRVCVGPYMITDPDGDPISVSVSGGAQFEPFTVEFLVEGNLCFNAPESGDYEFVITASDSCGSTSQRVVVHVTANAPPTWTLVPDTSVVLCTPGDSVCFTFEAADPDGDPLTYLAALLPDSLPERTRLALAPGATHCFVPTGDGTYRFVVMARDSCHAPIEDTAVVRVAYNTPPAIAFSYPDTTVYVCDPDTVICFDVNATDADGNPVTLREILNPGTFDPETGRVCFNPADICFDDPMTTDTTICLIFGASDGCPGEVVDSLCITVALNRAPMVQLPMRQEVIACEPGTVCLPGAMVSDPDGDPLQFETSPGASFQGGVLCFNAPEPGRYQVWLCATDPCGHVTCDTTEVEVRINSSPTVQFGGDQYVYLCEPGPICVDMPLVNDADGEIPVLQFEGAQQEGHQLCFEASGSGAHVIVARAIDSCGAVGADTIKVTVARNSAPRVIIRNAPPLTLCNTDTTLCYPVMISDIDGSPVTDVKLIKTDTRYWSWNGSVLCLDAEAGLSGRTQATFQAIVEATDTCGARGRDTITVQLKVNQPPTASLPADTVIVLCEPGEVCVGPVAHSDPDQTRLDVQVQGGVLSGDRICVAAPYDTLALVVLTVRDSCGLLATDTMRLDIHINEAPVLDLPEVGSISICALQPYCIDGIVGIDPETGVLPAALISGPGTFDPATGRLCFTPEQDGLYTFVFETQDQCVTVQGEWSVQVTTSQPPVWGPLPDSSLFSCQPGDSLCLDFSATDPEGDPILYALTGGPGRIDSVTGTVCFSPDTSGTYTFTVVAYDSCGQSQPATGQATVQVNRPPALVFSSPDTTITLCHSDTELCFQVTATDPDGGPLVIEEVLVPGFYDPETGGFCFNPDSICFSPPLRMDTTVCVVFKVTDSCGATTTDSLCVGLRVNRPPQLMFSSSDTTLYICRLDTLLCFGVSATDPEGDPVEIREILNPGEYYPETGTFCFQPSSVCYPNLPCSEPPTCIIFEAEDACGNITRDSLCLEIFANLPPVVVAPEADSATLCEPGQEICLSPVYGHDVEDGSLLVTAPGAIYDPLMQTLCFTADTAGLYQFTASVTDACAAKDSQIISVLVTANVPPQVQLPPDTAVSLCQPDTLCVDLVVTDPGDTWTVTQVTGPAYYDSVQGKLCVAVTAGPTIEVTLTVVDFCGASDTDTLRIEPSVNQPPIVSLPADFSVKVCRKGPYCLGPVTISDPDGNLSGEPVITGGTYNEDSGLVCIDVTGDARHTVIVSVADSCGLMDADTIHVDVTLNRAPVTRFSVPDTSLFLCTPDTTLCFVFSATDPDGGLVLLNEILNPGTFDPLTGEFCFNPTEICFDSPDTYDTTICLIFSATDTCGLEVWDTLCLQVTANGPPVVVAPADTLVTVCQGDSICLNPFVITDPNGAKDQLTVQSLGPAHVFDPATGSICFLAGPGTYQFAVSATDRCGLVARDSVVVTVTANRPPTVSLPADFGTTACAGEKLCIPVTANDPDLGDSVVVVAVTPQATYDPATSSVCLSPDTSGTYMIIALATDRCGLSDRDTIRVTVTMNRPPVWTAVPEIDTSFCVAPTQICLSVAAQDPDGHQITYTKTEGPGTINSLTGQICFGPLTQGLYSFVVQATDPCGSKVTDTARVNVRLNQPPVFAPVRDTLVAQCQPAQICFPPLTATDPNGGTLTYTLLAGSGSLSGNVYCFTPDTSGLYRTSVKVTDACGAADTVLFFASVSLNRPPVLTLPSPSTEFLCTVNELCVGGISAQDPESGPVTITKTAGPGTFNPSTGQLCFTPAAAGTYNFDFAATDTCGAQSTGRVTVTVLLNRAPTLDVPDRVTACRDSAVCIQVSGLDPDIGNRLTITQVSGPAGTFTPSPLNGPAPLSGQWCWTAQAAGSYLAVFQVADSCGRVAVDTTRIDVSDYCDTLCFAASIPAICPDEDNPDSWLFQGRAHEFPVMVTPSRDVGAFDFLIGYDASAMTVQSVQRGADISAWEFFTYRIVDPDLECSGACPSGLLRIVGIADINNGKPVSDPSQTQASTEAKEYARIVFQVSNDRTLAGQFVPVEFWWNDCGDNTFSSPLGDLYVATGIDPDTCVGAGAKELIEACATFQDGGGCIPRASDIDDRGDLNLNGIAYEIADAVLYSNYFILGRQAFDPDPIRYESQVAASDVNADGGPLTVADLVFLIRIIVGLQEPIDGGALKLTPAGEASAYWLHDGLDSRLVLENSGSLGGLALEARLAATPEHVELSETATQAGMELKWHSEGDRLKVLVYSLTGAALKTVTEPLFTVRCSTRPESIRVEAADDGGRVITVNLKSAPSLPTAFDLDPNFPNPFNPETEIRFTLHRDATVDLLIFNVLGQQVAQLVERERLVAGTHRYRWLARDERGGNLPSGVYMYRLSADGLAETRKMLLLR